MVLILRWSQISQVIDVYKVLIFFQEVWLNNQEDVDGTQLSIAQSVKTELVVLVLKFWRVIWSLNNAVSVIELFLVYKIKQLQIKIFNFLDLNLFEAALVLFYVIKNIHHVSADVDLLRF